MNNPDGLAAELDFADLAMRIRQAREQCASDLSCEPEYYTRERLPALLLSYVADAVIVETEEHVAREARAIVLIAADAILTALRTPVADDRSVERVRIILEEAWAVAEQVPFDFKYPPSADSIERRVERAEKVAAMIDELIEGDARATIQAFISTAGEGER